MPPRDNPNLREMRALLQEMKAMNTPFEHHDTWLGSIATRAYNQASSYSGLGKIGEAKRKWDTLSATQRKSVMSKVATYMSTWIQSCEVHGIDLLKEALDQIPQLHAKWVEIDSRRNNHKLFKQQTHDEKKTVMIEFITYLNDWFLTETDTAKVSTTVNSLKDHLYSIPGIDNEWIKDVTEEK